MYLLMLLATFISAIYGFNLSVRPDYDRDITFKKAQAVIYKFMFQDEGVHQYLYQRLIEAKEKPEVDTTNPEPGAEGVSNEAVIICSGDAYYGDVEKDESGREKSGVRSVKLITKHRQGGSGFSACASADNEEVELHNKDHDWLAHGRYLFSGDRTISKILCLNKSMEEDDADEVKPVDGDTSYDEAGNPIVLASSGGCEDASNRYLYSYHKIDARWLNRINEEISMDFMKTIWNRSFSENLGIIKQNDEGKWQFEGRINFWPVYAKDQKEWEGKCGEFYGKMNNPDVSISDDDRKEAVKQKYNDHCVYPADFKKRFKWDLPEKFFDDETFTDVSGTNKDFCKHGCLFRIKEI